jgi:STE24 endopeptidase
MKDFSMAFDAAAATAAYIDGLGPEALAKAAAYTSGGHWMLLWGLIVSGLTSWIVIRFGILDRISARLAARSHALRIWCICTAFMLLSAVISLPWALYEGWWRETSYGRTSQPLADFLSQGAIGLLLSALLGGLFFLGVYALIRKAGRTWWIWSGGLSAIAISVGLLLSPILIEPIFNDYKPVPPGPVRTALRQMADEAKIPHDRIFVFDGSRQSNNFTANVSGVFGSARIAISDVALDKASLDEVKAVTGHEIGHYVLHHVWRSVAILSLLSIALFFLADRLYPMIARLLGSQTTISDPVGFPVLMFIISLLSLLASPIMNGQTRIGESAADTYSLQTVNRPDALAAALVKTAEYRNPRPHPLAEFLFYTHPSVERRVRAAMEWKAKHPANKGS